MGLIDVDGHSSFPNLALMKISAWHKQQGDFVEWYNLINATNQYLTDFTNYYDVVYMSKVFTFTPDYEHVVYADRIEKGGTGYKDYTKVLPDEIENIFPDYSIYPNCDYAIGFLTRGCIRKCKWCVVPHKEGEIRPASTWQEIKRPDSNKIVFMDNNVLACEHGLSQIEELSHSDVKIDFNQALDARLVTKDIAKILADCKWHPYLRFSCDTSSMIPVIEEKVNWLKEYGMKRSKMFCYALIEDVEEGYHRIMELDRIGIEPFAQPYRDFNGGEPSKEQKKLARWCNMKAIFKSVKWEDYK